MRLLLPALAVLAAAPAARTDDDEFARRRATEPVKAAVEATGWKDDGKSLRMTWKDAGKMTAGGMTMAYTADWAVQTPGDYRFAMTFDAGGKKQTLTFVVAGDKAWESMDGQTREVTGDKLEYAKTEAYVFHVTSLAPLLRDPEFKLTAVGDKRIGTARGGENLAGGGRPAVGVRVERAGRPAVTLYFDRGTDLLVKYEVRVKDEFQQWKEVLDEGYYEDWKEVGGVKVPTKLRLVRDGKPLVESALSDMKVVDKLDAKLFEKP